ncbi:preprotein translocase subunit SecE [Anaplasma bovis]|uniref:preprotein translocase subunit SecE n=1 Tax=Anaplasma bovis TaxID=186733 RepID=UPI002FF03A67
MKGNGLLCFFEEMRQEVSQVAWATKGEVLIFLLIVVTSVIASSVLFSFVDFVFLRLVKIVLGVIYES